MRSQDATSLSVCLLFLAACAQSPEPSDGRTLAERLQPKIVSRSAWGSVHDPDAPFRTHVPNRITIHHSGVLYDGLKPAAQKLRDLQTWSRRERPWPDIPYHYLMDLGGAVYEARPVEAVGDTNTPYDPTGHVLICVMGNYEEQPFTGGQLDALAALCAWVCVVHGIPPESVKCHRDFAETTCPGRNILTRLEGGDLDRKIRARLAEYE
jgi:hypothetical protein